ncbi:hypothetical protein GVAV_002220 [Gurleya vavrai]
MNIFIIFVFLYEIKCGFFKRCFCCINRPIELENTICQTEKTINYEQINDERQDKDVSSAEQSLPTGSNVEEVCNTIDNLEPDNKNLDSNDPQIKISVGRFSIIKVREN